MADTPFREVSLERFKAIVQNPKEYPLIVALHYTNAHVRHADGYLALAHRQAIMIENGQRLYPGIALMAIRRDPSKRDVYFSSGFKVTPSSAYYAFGKLLGIAAGGPASPDGITQALEAIKNNLDHASAQTAPK